MKNFLKSLAYSLLACLVAGLVSYAVLPYFIPEPVARRASDLTSVQAVDLPASPSPIQADPSALSTSGWVFKVSASAVDDPVTGREVASSVEFQDTVSACSETPRNMKATLNVDNLGARAETTEQQLVCVPKCEGQLVPPPALTQVLDSRVDTSAFQEDFDFAPSEYAPQGSLTFVEWKCGLRHTRIMAAAIVALACNNQDCDDKQVTNVATSISVELGANLETPKALFPLQSVSRMTIVGTSAPKVLVPVNQ